MPADYDSPWKEALDIYFEAFLALLFPHIYAEIDWSRGYESLDKEFQQIIRDADLGRRYVDKLVKVWTYAGIECWVLIHVEVQTDREPEFPQRMYVYRYRIFDRYNKPVASLAVLADDDPTWRPTEYRDSVFGIETIQHFATAKLLDWRQREAELEASDNPFAKVALAYLKARETRDDPENRLSWKLRLVRGLLERGFSVKDVRELLRLIDWQMELPKPLSESFWNQWHTIEVENRMPYVASYQDVYHSKGLRRGIKLGLKLRFGSEGLKVMDEVEEIYGEERLEAILKALETAATLDEIRKLWATPTA